MFRFITVYVFEATRAQLLLLCIEADIHFYYSDIALYRHQWNNKLDAILKKNNLDDGTYQRNYEYI